MRSDCLSFGHELLIRLGFEIWFSEPSNNEDFSGKDPQSVFFFHKHNKPARFLIEVSDSNIQRSLSSADLRIYFCSRHLHMSVCRERSLNPFAMINNLHWIDHMINSVTD